MEAARVFLSLPFRTEKTEEEHPECLSVFDSRHMNRFFEALREEVSAAAVDTDGLQVVEIVLGNGSAAHLTADDLSGTVRLIRQMLPVSPHAAVRLTVTPAGFDFYKLSAVKQLQNASIRFELPGLTEERLRAGGYRCTPEKAYQALECCFQNGFRDFSVFLTAEDMPEEEAEATLTKLLAVHPEAILLRSDAEDGFVREVDRILTGEHWTRSGNSWYRDAVPETPRCSIQLGLGPGAVSVFDGTGVRSTRDFDFYCDHAGDFEALVRHAEEEEQ